MVRKPGLCGRLRRLYVYKFNTFICIHCDIFDFEFFLFFRRRKITMTERRDKGLPQLTPRDRYVLTWIGEQYAVRFDTLEKLLGHMPGKSHNQPTAPGKLNRKTVYRLI